VVTADEQSAGRGRQGRSWFAPAGGALLYSALLRPLSAEARPLLPLAVPLAVAEAAESLGAANCELKWPNDVWLEGRKLAGVLIETRLEWAVIGVGLNVAIAPGEFPPELRGNATSIGGEATVPAALRGLNERLADWTTAKPDRVLDGFRARDALAGKEIRWEGGAGVAAGIDDVGHLLVDTGGPQPAALGAGEVHLEVG
jgi:BirA family biotin operon repressor/biotin-[acetyl-CoA-carboxylase] ligase